MNDNLIELQEELKYKTGALRDFEEKLQFTDNEQKSRSHAMWQEVERLKV